MPSNDDSVRLTYPHIFLVRIFVFLALVGFVVFILQKEIFRAFLANPGLNGLILGVLLVGIILAVATVARLFREIAWVNNWSAAASSGQGTEAQAKGVKPVLLAPMARLVGEQRGLSTLTLRAILDSVATRLDESRETLRYMSGLLIFLGLLGTFWGLLETIGSIGDVIGAMKGGADSTILFEDLKSGIAKPLSGMGLSFTASLFGLAGSLVLGFLDLQAGQAQNRFYTELEDRLSAHVGTQPNSAFEGVSPELRGALDRISAAADSSASRASSVAMANLAEGVQALVRHMRSEQQVIRSWAEQQAEQNRDIKKALDRLAASQERR